MTSQDCLSGERKESIDHQLPSLFGQRLTGQKLAPQCFHVLSHIGQEVLHWAGPKIIPLWFFLRGKIGPQEILKCVSSQQGLEVQTEPSPAPCNLLSQANHFGFLKWEWGTSPTSEPSAPLVQWREPMVSSLSGLLSPSLSWLEAGITPRLPPSRRVEGVGSLKTAAIPSKEILYKSLLHCLTSFLYTWSGWGDQQSWNVLDHFLCRFCIWLPSLEILHLLSLGVLLDICFNVLLQGKQIEEKIISNGNKPHEEMKMGDAVDSGLGKKSWFRMCDPTGVHLWGGGSGSWDLKDQEQVLPDLGVCVLGEEKAL